MTIIARKEISTMSLLDGCYYCGAPAKHWDHVIPRSRAGDDSYDNLVPACPRCNMAKHDMPLGKFRRRLRSMGLPADFDMPSPRVIVGESFYMPGIGWQRFESEDGNLIIDDFNSYVNRITSIVPDRYRRDGP